MTLERKVKLESGTPLYEALRFLKPKTAHQNSLTIARLYRTERQLKPSRRCPCRASAA